MTAQEARELFSEAAEGTLSPELGAAFTKALASDPELAAEYDAFSSTVATLRAAGAERGTGEPGHEPDLLPGVQRRLRARSRGRFYADRFAERAGTRPIAPLLWALLLLVLLALAWFGASLLDVAVPVK